MYLITKIPPPYTFLDLCGVKPTQGCLHCLQSDTATLQWLKLLVRRHMGPQGSGRRRILGKLSPPSPSVSGDNDERCSPPSLCILRNPLVDRQPTTALPSSTITP